MSEAKAVDRVWKIARAEADLIVELPSLHGERVEMYFRNVAATGPEGFRMGSRNRNPYEEPVHRVVIANDFYLGTFVVTQEQWCAVWPEIDGLYRERGPWRKSPGARPSYHNGSGLLPVEQVSWYDALVFCSWLSREGKNKKDGRFISEKWLFGLPTEAEWEYACRGGVNGAGCETEYWNGNDKAALAQVGWYEANSGNCTHEVTEAVRRDILERHPFGLLGMHGNVWEWCHDEWDAGRYRRRVDGDRDRAAEHRWQVLRALASGGLSALASPLLPPDRDRVFRGGSWIHPARYCRSAYRNWSRPGDRHRNHGFRACLVRDPAAEQAPAGGGAATVSWGGDGERAERDKAGGPPPRSSAAGEAGADR